MNRSESINELATALSKAQGEIENAKKDARNPHYNSTYADLASVLDAIREPFAKHGLSIIQCPRLVSVGESSWLVECETTMLHTSGQFISDTLAIPVTRVDAQGVGSAITYARRYHLMPFAGIAPEDDDANAAVGSTGERPAQWKPAGEPGVATVKVLGIVKRPSGTGDKYVISCDDRQTYQSFNVGHAEAAKAAQAAGQPVEIKFLQESWGRKVVSITEVAVEQPAL